MIILEGLDKTGKTTLQEGLLNKYPFMFPYKLEKANIVDNDFDDCDSDYWKEFVIIQKAEMRTIIKLQEQTRLDGMIIDRFHGTEWAYSGNPKDEELGHIWEFDSRIQRSEFPSVLIFLDAPTQWIWARLDDKERRVIDRKKLKRFHRRYQIFFECSKLPKIKISVEKYDIQGVLALVETFLSIALRLDLVMMQK